MARKGTTKPQERRTETKRKETERDRKEIKKTINREKDKRGK
jgi:hypothetical protein